MKTVTDLCKEALELRGKATQGEWTTAGDIYIFSNHTMVADNNDDEAVLRARGVGGGMSVEQQKFNIGFCAHAANHITQIAERCLELEGLVMGAHLSMTRLESENQRLKSAIELVKKQRDEYHMVCLLFKDEDHVRKQTERDNRQLEEALKGG